MRIIYVISLVLLSISVSASDSSEIVSLQKEVSRLKTEIQQIHQEDVNIKKLCLQQANDVDSLRNIHQQKLNNIDSLCEQQKVQADGLNTLADKVGADLTETNKKIDVSANVAACGIFIALVLLVIIYLMLRNKIHRGSSSIDKIKVAQESLEAAQKAMQEESVKLDGKLVELLDKQLKQNTEPKQDHSFVLDIANEIARIEQNLAFMDTKVKGVSNLKNRAAAINDRLKSKGYEIPKLVGEKYIDGNNMKPTMELDEDLPVGTQIIRRVLKPMVMYNGEMIQAAEVVVAYNE